MKRQLIIFYVVWAVLGLLQCYFIEVADDEAYYWVCGQFLDWGSYHTPPLVPFLSKIGYQLLNNELGVRLFYFILHMLTLVLLERLTKPKDTKLFIVILSSFVIIHIAGFWAVPDIPYLFFSVLLISLMERYAQQESILISILLGITMALIIYSKYHGIIIIGSLFIANLKLFKRPSFYAIGLLSILLLTPHIIWLWNHDFITINFHWLERERQGYHWYYPLHYLLGLFLITGPIIGFLLIPSSLKFKPSTQQEKNLKYILIGVILFFFVLSFRNRIEANWMIVLLIPLTMLGYKTAENSSVLKKWIYYSFPFALFLAFCGRFFLTFDILPRENKLFLKLNEFHGNKKWVHLVEERAGDLPIIFQQGHQIPSKYYFYSKTKRVGNITPYNSLSSQYELENIEKIYQGQKVLHATGNWTPGNDFIHTSKGFLFFTELDSFCSYSHIRITTSIPSLLKNDTSIDVPINVTNYKELDLACPKASKTFLSYYITQGNELISSKKTAIGLNLIMKKQGKLTLPIELPEQPGKYALNIALDTEGIIPTHNSKRIPIVICD